MPKYSLRLTPLGKRVFEGFSFTEIVKYTKYFTEVDNPLELLENYFELTGRNEDFLDIPFSLQKLGIQI